MRIRGTVTDAQYKKGVSSKTGNDYELTQYVMQSTDEQGRSHRVTFVLSGQKMYNEKVHKGDNVEVSVQLGIREWKGSLYNDVVGCFYVCKLDEKMQNTKEQMVEKQAVKTAQIESVVPEATGGLPF